MASAGAENKPPNKNAGIPAAKATKPVNEECESDMWLNNVLKAAAIPYEEAHHNAEMVLPGLVVIQQLVGPAPITGGSQKTQDDTQEIGLDPPNHFRFPITSEEYEKAFTRVELARPLLAAQAFKTATKLYISSGVENIGVKPHPNPALDVLRQAIVHFERALQLSFTSRTLLAPNTDLASPDIYRSSLACLGIAYITEHVFTGEHDSLDRALKYFDHRRTTYGSLAPGHQLSGSDRSLPATEDKRVETLCRVARFARTKHFETGKLEFLDQTITCFERAVELIGSYITKQNGFTREDYGSALEGRYRLTEMQSDIETAYHQHSRALEIFSFVPSFNKYIPNSLIHKNITMLEVYRRREAEYIRKRQPPVSTEPNQTPITPTQAYLIATSNVIKTYTKAIDDHKEYDLVRFRLMHNLGLAHLSRHRLDHREATLRTAIKQLEYLAGLLKKDYDRRVKTPGSSATDTNNILCRVLSSLGTAYRYQYEHSGGQKGRGDLDTALEYYQKALEAYPDEHPGRSFVVHNRFQVYDLLLNFGGTDIDLEEALSDAKSATEDEKLPLAHRFEMALRWVKYASHEKDAEGCLAAYDMALKIRTLSIFLHRTMTEQLEYLTDLPQEYDTEHVASAAAAIALALDKPEKAIEFIDRGDALIASQLGQYQTVVKKISDEMKEKYPNEVKELITAARLISMNASRDFAKVQAESDSSAYFQDSGEITTHARHRSRWEKIYEKMLSITGFEDAFKSASYEKLKSVAANGPVIVMHIYRPTQSQLKGTSPHVVTFLHEKIGFKPAAIILESDRRPQIVELDKLGYEQLDELNRLVAEKAFGGGGKGTLEIPELQKQVLDLLGKLWAWVVQPIYLALNEGASSSFDKTSSSTLPKLAKDKRRVWWSPQGSFWAFPLHGAGNYANGGVKFSDDFVSSYVPSLTTLRELQSRPKHDTSRARDLLLVPEGNPKGAANQLKEGIAECKAIQTVFGKKNIPVKTFGSGAAVSRNNVLTELKKYRWVHFSCHGQQDGLGSRLIMDDGKPLRLLDFLREYDELDHRAEFAYLSACETAMGERNARDEAIHLAAGMLLVGYESVIGSMWKVNAKDSEFVVTPFYESMLGDGGGNSLHAARALHDALIKLRNEKPESVNGWVNIVHWGI